MKRTTKPRPILEDVEPDRVRLLRQEKPFTNVRPRDIKAGKTLWVIFNTVHSNGLARHFNLEIYPVYCVGRVVAQPGLESMFVPVRTTLLDKDRNRFGFFGPIWGGEEGGHRMTIPIGPGIARWYSRNLAGIYKTYRQALNAVVLMIEDDEWRKRQNDKHVRSARTLEYSPLILQRPVLPGREHTKRRLTKSPLEKYDALREFMREMKEKFPTAFDWGDFSKWKKDVPEDNFVNLLKQNANFTDTSQILSIHCQRSGKSMLNDYLAEKAKSTRIRIIQHKQRDPLTAMSEPYYFEFSPPEWVKEMLNEPKFIGDVRPKGEPVRDDAKDKAGLDAYIEHVLGPDHLLTNKKPFFQKFFTRDEESEPKDDESKT